MSFRGVETDINISSSDSDSDSGSQFLETRHRSRSRSPISFVPLVDLRTELIMANEASVLKSEYLNMIPEFHGETELLPRFLEICEKLVTKFYITANPADFQNEYLMSSILSKVKGDAMLSISSCVIKNWSNLKTALLNTYSDKRDAYTLNIELVELRQGNENAFEFYNKIQHILNLKTAYITVHSDVPEAEVLIEYSRNLALRVLLRGLKDPIGSLMRAKNPADLNSALNMLTNDFQIESTKHSDKSFVKKPNFQPKQNQQHNFKFYQPPQPTYFASNFPRPSNNLFNNNRPNFIQRPPQPKPSTSNQNSGPPRNQYYKPTPMSISTQNTFRPQQNNQRSFAQNQTRPSTSRPNFVFEELYNIESEVPENAENSENNDDSRFFREPASEETNFQNTN